MINFKNELASGVGDKTPSLLLITITKQQNQRWLVYYRKRLEQCIMLVKSKIKKVVDQKIMKL